jgi:hypothetical protein
VFIQFLKSSFFIFAYLCASFTFAINAQIAAQEPQFFKPRLENVQLILTEKKINEQPSIAVFTNVTNLVLKSALAASKKIYSLLSWQTVVSKKTINAPAYIRKIHFGSWVKNSSDSNCYSTRAKVLIRDSKKSVTFKDNNCTVDSGEWLDPYSLETLTNAQDMQIDHMVPLKDAYISGAYKWTYQARCLYGNYLGYKAHLISAYGEENNQKGDQTPADYMPPNDAYKCQYLKDWLFVKGLWGLTMDTAEASAIKDLIQKHNCDTKKMTITDKEIAEQTLFANQNKNLCADHVEK